MSEFKVGDRVKVEFEGVIIDTDPDGTYRVDTPGHPVEWAWVIPENMTKIETPLPTKLGTVIESNRNRFMLTRGGWRADSDTDWLWNPAELQASMYGQNFTVLLEGK